MVDLPAHVKANIQRYIKKTTLVSSNIEIIEIARYAYTLGYDAGIETSTQRIRGIISPSTQTDLVNPETDISLGLSSCQPAVIRGGSLQRKQPILGSVRDAVVEALRESTVGLTEKEIKFAIERLNPALSGRSASSELHRFKNSLYKKEDGRWFIIDSNPLNDKRANYTNSSISRFERRAPRK